MTWVLVLPALFAAAIGLASPAILRALPPPVDEPDGDPYRRLATPGVAAAVFALVAAAATLAVVAAPHWRRPGWAWPVPGCWPRWSTPAPATCPGA